MEFPTGSLPVIRVFQTDKPQMRKLKKKRSSWSITFRFARHPLGAVQWVV
jgi:hypothetical protein